MKQRAGDQGGSVGYSLRDYWTTGTISSLCDAVTDLGQITIELRDERGLVLDSNSFPKDQGIVRPIPEGALVKPILVADESVGSIIIYPHTDRVDDKAYKTIERIGHFIAMTASEICADVSQLRYRIEETGVLYKLSSLLAKGGRVKDMLGLTLELAIEVLELDAGAIMLLPEDAVGIAREDIENELERSAAIGLSEEWLNNPVPLSKGRIFDRLSLAGEVVTSEKLSRDDRVLVPDESIDEGLVSFVGTGMVFDQRPIGVIRLYSRLPRVFSSAEQNLIRSISESAAAAVEQARLLKLQAHQRRTERSLRIAGAVQKRMLPEQTPRFENIELAGRYRPSQEIGGDFYDLFVVRDQLGVLVGDVVGKGVVAGLLMCAVRATIRAYAELFDDVSRVMVRTNNAVCRDTIVSEFVTIWYGMIDPQTLEMRHVNAGHEPPMLVRKHKDQWQIQSLQGSGLVVGVLENEEYTMHTTQLHKGDFLIAFTDGITDAINFDMQRFRKSKLEQSIIEFLNETPDPSAQQVLERIFWSIRQFVGLQHQADDETLVVVKITNELMADGSSATG